MDVLLVDDDEEIRTLLSELLIDEGYRVRSATHGREALDMLADHGVRLPSLILLDLMMPEMDGLAVLDALAASERLRRIPVVVTTAAPGKAAGRSFSAIVQKPYTIPTLLDAIRQHETAGG